MKALGRYPLVKFAPCHDDDDDDDVVALFPILPSSPSSLAKCVSLPSSAMYVLRRMVGI